MNNPNLLKKFLNELRYRVNIKSSNAYPKEIALLDSFKYYDTYEKGDATLRMFLKVIKLKLGINNISDDEITEVFEYYLKLLESDNKSLDYREFISLVLDVNNVHSVRSKIKSSKHNSNTFQKAKLKAVNEEEIGIIMEFILYRLRKKKLYSFLRLFRYMEGVESYKFDYNLFVSCFEKVNLELKKKEFEALYDFFLNKENLFDRKKFWKVLSLNYSDKRKNLVGNMFGRLNFRNKKVVNIQPLRDIFIPRNYPKVKSGIESLDDADKQFHSFMKEFQTLKSDFNTDIREFYDFMKFISMYFQDEKDFSDFINHCFRYNDIKKHSLMLSMNDLGFKNRKKEEIITQEDPKYVVHLLKKALNRKGNSGYINLYIRCKTGDIDKDSFLFYNEFKKVIKDMRCKLDNDQMETLFNLFSNKKDKKKFDYNLLLDELVPYFDKENVAKIEKLFYDLNGRVSNNEVDFQRIQNSFTPKNHPSYRNGEKNEHEIKSEFLQSLQNFLVYYQGSHSKVEKDSFIRFFEFYAKNWDQDFLNNILNITFKVKSRIRNQQHNHHQNIVNVTPYAIDSKFKKKNNLYDEFQKSKVTQKREVQYPYYTERESNKYSKVDKISIQSKSRNYNREQSRYQNTIEDKKETKNSKKSRISISQRSEKISRRSKKVTERSIDSLLSRPDKNSIQELNNKIQKLNSKSKINESNPITEEEYYIPEMAPINKMRQLIRSSKKFALLLELEYQLTNICDENGYIDFNGFSGIISNFKTLENLKKSELIDLFKNHKDESNQLHVQTFMNYLRDQMNESQENITVDTFDTICSRIGCESLKVNKFKNAFVPRKFIYSNEEEEKVINEMFGYVVDLFVCLNVSIKGRDFFDIDDFLYMFDNFTFFLQDNEVFKKMMKECFK